MAANKKQQKNEDVITIKKDHLYLGVIVVLLAVLVASLFTGGFGFKQGGRYPGGTAGSGNGTGSTAGSDADTGSGTNPTEGSGQDSGSGQAGVPAALSATSAQVHYVRGTETTPELTNNDSELLLNSIFDNDIKIGSDDAPVVLVEFADFQCPFCRMYWRETFHGIIEDYVETGKVQYIFRDFPLSFHPMSQKSAEAVECARDQQKWWEMHEKMFVEQDKFGQSTITYSVDDLKNWASDINGLDTDEFNACLDSGTHADEVRKDYSDGLAVAVQGTPGFYVGRRGGSASYINGAQPYAVFSAYFEALLAEEGS